MGIHQGNSWIRRRLSDLAQLRVSARATDLGWVSALARFSRLVLKEQYSPAEVFMLGFMANSGPIDQSKFISKERMLAVQLRANPRNCFEFTEDKLVFYRRCIEHDLTTPRVHVALGAESSEAGDVPIAADASQLAALLATDEPRDLVFKPVAGVHGHGVLILRLERGMFRGADGKIYTADDLVAEAARSDYRSWLIQDRLYPHPALVKLSGSQFLQTARVVSCLDPDGRVRIPIAWLRIIASAGAFDNFNFGESGNLVATIELPSGGIDHVFAPGPPGHGVAEIARHPVTGANFADFTLPFAAEVHELVTRAARAFAPLRTIGWDVAITDSGPSLIEGNVTWDPLPTKRNLRAIADSLQ